MAKMLGKRPPVNRPTIRMAEFFRPEKLPDHPEVNHAPRLIWPMDRNDQAGVCVVAGLDHTLQVIAHHLGLRRENWSDNQILELYRTQNPDFHDWSQGNTDADQGMVIQTFLEEMVRRGEIVAFGRVDHDDPDIMRAATYIGLSIVTGAMLQEAQQDQEVWDYVKGSPSWGGHCTNTVGYASASPGQQEVITWGECVLVTDEFVSRQMDEAWMVVTQSMINHPDFRNAFDLRGFARTVRDLTDGKIDIPVPDPVPNNPIVPITPTPPPPVPSDPALDDFPFRQLDAWVNHPTRRDSKREREAREAYTAWKAKHNLGGRSGQSRFRVVDEHGNVVGEIDNLGQGFFAAQG